MADDPYASIATQAEAADAYASIGTKVDRGIKSNRPTTEKEVALDIIKQFVGNIPRGMAQTADLAEMGLNMPATIGRGVRYLLGDKKSQSQKWEETGLVPSAPTTRAGEYAATVGETVGGSIVPGAGMLGAARSIAGRAVTTPATTAVGRFIERGAQSIANNPGRAITYDLASAVTGGVAQQAAKETGAGPVGQTVAAIGGSLVPAVPSMLAAPINRVRSALVNQGRTGAYTRFASELPDGDIDTFANQVATGTVGQGAANQRVQRRTLDILGEEMERAGQDRGRAIQSTINRIVNEFNVTPATARNNIRALTSVHRDSPLMLSEYSAAAPSNATIRATRDPDNIDLRDVARPADSGTQRVVDYLANRPGQSAIDVRNAVNERNLGMRDVMREGLQEFGPNVPGTSRRATIEDLTQMQEGARQAANLAYRQTYQPGMTNERMLIRFLPRIIDGHLNRMRGRAGAPANALRQAVDEFFITRPNGQRIAMMDLQMLQDARGSLRDQIDTARRGGQTKIAQTLQPLYRDITRLMERSNPQWARANRAWADMSINEVARELGEAFSTKAGPQFRAQVQQYRQLAPEAQNMVQVEFLQKLFDKLDNLGDTHDVAKLFATDHIRNAVRELFGADAAVELARLTRDAAIATRSARALQGSQTHMRGQVQREFDADTGVMAAAQDLNIKAVRQAIWEKFAAFWTERRNRPMAGIATTPMQDTAEVARHIHNMRTAQEFVRRVAERQPIPVSPRVLTTTIGAASTAEEPHQ